MFLRKLISTSLIIVTSVGASVTLGSDVQDMFSPKSLDQRRTRLIAALSIAISQFEKSTSKESDILLDANVGDLVVQINALKEYVGKAEAFRFDLDRFKSTKAQNAERRALSNNQRKLLRRVTQTFKVPTTFIHQPR